MSLNKDIDDKIMKYLDGLMTAKEVEDFEKDRQNSAELDELVSIMERMNVVYDDNNWHILNSETEKVKQAQSLFNTNELESFSNKIKSSEHRYKNKTSKSINTTKALRYIAGIAAILLIAFSLNYFFNLNSSSYELFDKYYSTQDLPSFALKNNNTSTISEAEVLFKEGKYAEALHLFSAINTDENPSILIYQALAHLNLDESKTAIKYLDTLEKSGAIDFHKAYWFKALVYLKQDQKDKALLNLKELAKNEAYFNHEKAVKLLEELE